MHIGKSYGLLELLSWTRRRSYVLVLLSFSCVAAYELLGLKWLALPWPVAAVLGTAISFIVGFKNAQTYNRTQEAQQVWTALAALTRYWALICRDFPKDTSGTELLIRRHLAWLTVLRYHARGRRVWESTATRSNDEYQRRNFKVPEREIPLQAELQRLLPREEADSMASGRNKLGLLMGRQSAAIRTLHARQEVVPVHHNELQRTLKDLLDQQARVERIKNFPYPRQYAVINTVFVWSFAALLPLSLVREFERFVQPAGMPSLVWLAAPVGVLVAWLYTALDQVGESTENPFEGGANDVPISTLCQRLETELLGTDDVLPETGLRAQGATFIL